MENVSSVFLQLVEESKKTKKLELFNCDLEELIKIISSDEIFEKIFMIEDLEELHLSRLPFSILPNNILNLRNLKSIIISNNQLKIFPTILMKCNSLTKVTIINSNIIELPHELDNWTQLLYLNIENSKQLKNFLGLPPNLTYLNFSYCNLSELPDNLFKLKGLRKLVIENLELGAFPSKLFEMKSLASLFAGGNNLKSLQKGIENLENLIEIWLRDNNFNSFPTELLTLSNLLRINLSDNNISKIPKGISKLEKLTFLDLGSNCFNSFPQNLLLLKKLSTLRLGNFNLSRRDAHFGNAIRKIPDEIIELQNLKELELFQVPITNIPAEIIKEGFAAIKNFIESRIESEKEEFLYEAKMVIVGRGNVGKTVLTKKITDPDYVFAKSDSTYGISILKNPFSIKIKNGNSIANFHFNIWDFGGQEKYDATHQLFITDRSIYLFLTEAREESNYLDFYYWLNTIKLFSKNCPVIVVLSKYDERKKILPESIYKEKFENIVDFIDVSCKEGYEYTIENLKKAIAKAIESLPQTKQKLSNRWVEVRSQLEKLSNKKDYIGYDEYLKVCAKEKLNRIQANFLSQFLNDLGVIIHRQGDLLLKKTVFINPDWCVDGLYKVLDSEIVYKKNGVFNNSDLDEIWGGVKFKNKQPELLKLMQEYNLCFELKDKTGFLAPDLLPPDKPNIVISEYKTSALQVEYRYDFMPAGILTRFIVKSHSFIKENLYWKYGVVLQYDNTEAIIEEDYIHSKIKIGLNGENKKGLLSAIRMYINEVHLDFDKSNKLVFEEMVPCNCIECSGSMAPHFYKFNVLKKFELKSKLNISCEQSGEDVKVISLINDVQSVNISSQLVTNEDLRNFILDIIENVLKNEIANKEGFLNFWRDKKCTISKDETEIQPYISNVLDNYCKINGVLLSREVREASGHVDILLSFTNINKEILKVCLEIKKASHQDVETAIQTQLVSYMDSVGTEAGIYLVVWSQISLNSSSKKYHNQQQLSESIFKNNPDHNNISIKILDVTKPISPSKRKI